MRGPRALLLFQLLLAAGAVPEDCAGDDACEATPGQAYLQTRNHAVANTVVEEDTAELSAEPIEIPDVEEDDAEDAETQEVRVERAADGRSVRVSFVHGGVRFQRNLSAASVFAKDAKVMRHTARGEVARETSRPVTFISREPKRFATVSLLRSGGILGLFQQDGRIVRVKPAENVSAGHVVQSALLQLHDAKPQTEAEEEEVEEMTQSAEDEEVLAQRVEKFSSVHEDDDWEGEQWWGGGKCYPDDDSLHLLMVTVLADHSWFEKFGEDSYAKLEHIVAESSFVYEHQLHIRVLVGYMKVYESEKDAPAFAVGCPEDRNPVFKKIHALRMDMKSAVVRRHLPKDLGYEVKSTTHLFTACGPPRDKGRVGCAYPYMCIYPGYSIGVNGYFSWHIFAHELGHQFKAHDRPGKGGVMDGGDGKFQGEYQFNGVDRGHVCSAVKRFGTCDGYFIKA